ncbi:MAG TPA: ABC transporter permease [Patescibacteria group bacterium]|nr:ABC transporter permease [Patescibacteria group bacterium]
MELREIIIEAFSALNVNKLRTVLATLGIVIGIGAVIALVSLGQGGQKAVESQIQSLGSNLLTVIPGAIRPGDIRSLSGTSNNLTLDDAKAIMKDSANLGVENVSAELLRRATVSIGRENTSTQVVGILPTYQTVRNVQVASGVFISQSDMDGQTKVAVLGPQVVSDLFGDGANPVGQTIRVNKIAFKIIGITASKGGVGASNQDDIVLIPLSTAQKILFGVDYLGSISIQVTDQNKMDDTRDKIGYFLLARHKIQNPTNADFTIFSQNDILASAQQITGIFTTILSGIAAISLLVGGIGIMNIMLVTVVERTREIGLRKALGAKRDIVIKQFLVESIMLTVAGGALGMMLGILISFLVSRIISLPFIVSPFAVVLAIGVSGIIGILFGWYPAKRAANLSPIEALRYE